MIFSRETNSAYQFSSLYHRSDAIHEEWFYLYEISSDCSAVTIEQTRRTSWANPFLFHFSLALANDRHYENFLPPILSFGFETIYLSHPENNLPLAFKLLKKYRNNLLLIGKHPMRKCWTSASIPFFSRSGGLVDGRLYKRAGLEELVQLPSIDHFQGELVPYVKWVCATPSTLTGKKLGSLSDKDFLCEEKLPTKK